MTMQIAVAGKGGTGKTSFCALLIKYLIDKGKTPILAVDADANANLNEALGIKIENETVSELIAKTKDLHGIPEGMSQETYIEYRLNAALSESKDVDLLVMGGPEGPGCYCFPNNLLRKYLDHLSGGYKYIVMDNEAGLEHISRRTTRDVDILFVISDNSARSIRSAGRVNELVKQIKTKVNKIYLIVTRATEQDIENLREEIEKTGLPLAGIIPTDPLVTEYDIKGKPLFELPADSGAAKAVNEILDRLKL
ncbi:MAG: AAA family ATPase [Clostridiales bacterium]|jgi:CO dehydrogenase maturation factor|nr:AAA family ATPase [Eubacteriales bacterium]MDH7565663.1 AAA family ATPase [Clostridiales bacterium]